MLSNTNKILVILFYSPIFHPAIYFSLKRQQNKKNHSATIMAQTSWGLWQYTIQICISFSTFVVVLPVRVTADLLSLPYKGSG